MVTVRKFHRYFALFLGAFFAIWVISGVMMLLPAPKPLALTPRVDHKVDFSRVTVAPGEVIRNLGREVSRPVKIDQVILRPLRDRPVYEIRETDAAPSLWDSVTGERITISPELAVMIVRDHVRADVGKATTRRIENHTLFYPWGPLPAYKVEFANGRGTIAYVGVAKGSIIFTDWRKRAWHLFTGLHEFIPLDVLFGEGRIRRPVLITVALLALVIVITGFCLEFLPRAKGKQNT